MTDVGETTKEQGDARAKEELAVLEAALYVAGRPLDLKVLGRLIGTRSKRRVRQLGKMLKDEYSRRDTALEVLELEDQRFVLQLKTNYSSQVRKLAVRPLLTDGPLKTLAYIAYRQPVIQAQVIDVRGAHAYRHIRQMVEMGLVNRDRKGKSMVLETTEYFADYFGLSHDFRIMKRQLRRVFDDVTKGDAPTPEQQNRESGTPPPNHP